MQFDPNDFILATPPKKKRVGYVALIGRPNSGKSSFINALTDEKVSIVSSRPQTTRKLIRGIYNDSERQIIFFDTPGIHESSDDFNIQVNGVALRSLQDADGIVRFIDSSRTFWGEEEMIDQVVKNSGKPFITVYSKWDKALPGIAYPEGTIKLSSLKNIGLRDIVSAIDPFLEESFPLYDEDYYTDQDPYTRVSEIIREKAFNLLSEEIPHDIYVSVEELEDTDTGMLKILAYLCVERDSQKRIVIGKAGTVITQIGTEARMELEKIFGRKVFLALRVKTVSNWKKSKKILDSILSSSPNV